MAKANGHAYFVKQTPRGTSRVPWMNRIWNDQDHDPMMDVVKTAIQDHGRFTTDGRAIKEHELATIAGLSPNTVKNLVSGETMRPQFKTYAKIIGAIGGRFEIRFDDNRPDFERELERAKEERRLYFEKKERAAARAAARAK